MSASRKDIIVHGIIAATIGYGVVAILFGAIDFIHGRPVYATAAYLGTRITGHAFAGVPPFDPAPVIAFNAVHFVLMLGAGFCASLLVHRWPQAAFLPFFAFGAGALAALLASFALAAGLLGAVYAVDLLWINLAATAALASYLLVRPAPPPTRLQP